MGSHIESPPLFSNSIQIGEEEPMLKNFLLDETGAELAEYGVAVALLVAIALVIYQVLGQGISDANSQTAEAMQNPNPGVTP